MKVLVVGGGNAAYCAAISALENGAEVEMLEKANQKEAGGNSMYTAGAMRFVYNNKQELLPLLLDPEDEKLGKTDFGSYSKEKFREDLLGFNDGRKLSLHQNMLIDRSYDTISWMSKQGIKFEPIYGRQSFVKNDRFVFWGGLTLASEGEGVGLIEAENKIFKKLGGKITYQAEATALLFENNKVKGVSCLVKGKEQTIYADAIVLGCGGFEASPELRKKYMGGQWEAAKVRGTSHNTGRGIEMALEIGAAFHGVPDGCHATPMDKNMPNYGNPDIPHFDRKNYRKICYFLGIMLNNKGFRFVDEGVNFRNYTYAQFGRAILNQPNNSAWQIFDQKVEPLLYNEYRFWDASFIEANSIEDLIKQMPDVDQDQMLQSIKEYNYAVDESVDFDPTILDGKGTKGLDLNKTNWANKIDQAPFRAYPVTCGITFTYAGLKVDENAAVLNKEGQVINGLYACGELVGGVFYNGYPGGSGLTSGAVFGRIAGKSAAKSI